MVSVDFIVELPEAHGSNTVMNIMDSVSERAHFITTTATITTLRATWLYLAHVWKLHGLPKQVISDHRPQFVAEFTQELYCLLGSSWQLPQLIILSQMGRQKGSIKSWNSTSDSS